MKDSNGLHISDIQMMCASEIERQTGLLGWVSLNVDSFRVTGITLRRTLTGNMTLSYPARNDKTGRQHFYIRPMNDSARREIEYKVFQALGIEGSAS